MRVFAKAHYGDEDFEFDTCIIKVNVEPGIHTCSFTPNPLSSDEYGDLMRSFEPPVDEETYDRITEKEKDIDTHINIIKRNATQSLYCFNIGLNNLKG